MIPKDPKIYHIVHADRLHSIISDGNLWSDDEVQKRSKLGPNIGMDNIKKRRLTELRLSSHPDLYVGQCVPFYFCPRSVMLFLIYKKNPELQYKDGQEPIIHFEADLRKSVNWATQNNKRWAFTLSNAGSRRFEDRSSLDHLQELDWEAIQSNNWAQQKEGKQAEFLVERSFPWMLVERIGVQSSNVCQQVTKILESTVHRPKVEIIDRWYYGEFK